MDLWSLFLLVMAWDSVSLGTLPNLVIVRQLIQGSGQYYFSKTKEEITG